jgi:hypothetical protein
MKLAPEAGCPTPDLGSGHWDRGFRGETQAGPAVLRDGPRARLFNGRPCAPPGWAQSPNPCGDDDGEPATVTETVDEITTEATTGDDDDRGGGDDDDGRNGDDDDRGGGDDDDGRNGDDDDRGGGDDD